MTRDPAPVWFPTPEILAGARINGLMDRMACGRDYDLLLARALEEPEALWRATEADLDIVFDRPWHTLVNLWEGKPWPRWFVGGRLNFVASCLRGDRPAAPPPDRPALLGYSETGRERRYTYAELERAVRAAAAGLAGIGVERGTRVAILLPNVPEAAIAFLAVAWLGGIVVPLYSGFGPDAVATRLADSGAEVLVTADGTVRGGRIVDLKPVADEAAGRCPTVRRICVVTLTGQVSSWQEGRDVRWERMAGGDPAAAPPMAVVDPNTPFMLIYTSGTTGKPKGTVHLHGGFPLRVAQDVAYLFDVHPGDRLFWFSDMGWMIGPMMICSSLMLGATLVLYDGAPARPDPFQLLRIAERAGVSHFGAAPTLLRAMAASGREVPAELVAGLRVLMSAGEVLDEETFDWYFRQIGRGRLPIINYTGGTEVSGGILGNVVLRPIAPSTFNTAAPGVDAAVFDDEGRPLVGQEGELVLRQVAVGMTQGFWQDQTRYIDSYWSRYGGTWAHGDRAIRYPGGLWRLCGRSDDVLKVAGRRLGPSEIETIVLEDPRVALAAVIGVPDERLGEALILCVVPKSPVGETEADPFTTALSDAIERRLGKGLRPKRVLLVEDLPRTRNAKIMRRLIKRAVLGEPFGDVSALENPAALDAVRRAVLPAEQR